jgi:hypothetical protein
MSPLEGAAEGLGRAADYRYGSRAVAEGDAGLVGSRDGVRSAGRFESLPPDGMTMVGI